MTGFSQTKVNRCLAEGRERFRAFLSRSESGGRCAELRPLLSAFCDGEASAEETGVAARAPAGLRPLPRGDARLPGGAAGRPPRWRRLPIVARPLLERAHEALAGLQARLPGRRRRRYESSLSQVAAAGGAGGIGAAASPRCWRSAPAPPAARRSASAPGWSRARWASTPIGPSAPHVERAAKSLHREAGAGADGRNRSPSPSTEAEREAPLRAGRSEPPPQVAASAEVAGPVESTAAANLRRRRPPAPAAAQRRPANPAGEFGP